MAADGDEGFALIQALLVRRGHPLYSETWSDQPPGYTWMVAAWSRVFGDAPEVIRLSTALLLAIFAFAVFELSRTSIKGLSGYAGGFACVAALLLQNGIFNYGCAAMVSLPAVLFVGLGWVVSSRSSSPARACLTGALVALGLAIKPLGAPALPGILVAVFANTWIATRSKRRAFESLGLALGSAAAVCALFFWPVFLREGGETVYRTHELTGSSPWPGAADLARFVKDDVWLVSSAAIGLAILGLRRRTEALSLGLWVALGALALSRYEPVWSHHRYLVLIPAVPLFGLGLGSAIETTLTRAPLVRRSLAAVALLAACAAALLLFPKQRFGEIGKAFGLKVSKETAVVRLVRQGVPHARRMVTSRQMYAYRLGLDIPPSQAVTSRKRFQRWKLSAKELVEVSLAFDPDVVALDDRWPESAAKKIRHELAQSHALIYNKPDEFVLARKTMMTPELLELAQQLHGRKSTSDKGH